jgi:hypothetical protein
MFLDASRFARSELSLAGVLCRLAQRDRLTVECTDLLADIDILPHETGDTLERREAANGLFFICHIKRGKAWSNFFRRWPADAAGSRRR